jgi:hypothetical protein
MDVFTHGGMVILAYDGGRRDYTAAQALDRHYQLALKAGRLLAHGFTDASVDLTAELRLPGPPRVVGVKEALAVSRRLAEAHYEILEAAADTLERYRAMRAKRERETGETVGNKIVKRLTEFTEALEDGTITVRVAE